MYKRFWFTVIIFGLLLLPTTLPTHAQTSAACGVVDAIDYPIDELVPGYDDFARYRQRFGGNHTGIDIGFDRWADPVRAAARGRVTYADPEGWDTEKGVVIIEHIMPDNTIAYSLYGHMEETDIIGFPQVGQCVERGSLVGTIGWPSRGRPHLHYEIRKMLPNDGGPGYVTTNPLDEGWYNPLDFTELWRARLNPAYVASITFDRVASLPPIQLDTGEYVIASGDLLTAVSPPSLVLWRIQTDGLITGLAGLSGGRVAAHTENGQVLILQNGRYAAVWSQPGASVPFLAQGETLIFLTPDAGLAAYNTIGTALWSLPGTPGATIQDAVFNGSQVAVTLQTTSGILWRLLDMAGQTAAELPLRERPITTPTSNGWMLLNSTELIFQNGSEVQALANVSPLPGSTAQITVDIAGNTYVYLGDADNTLLTFDSGGALRWRTEYPREGNFLPPLLRTGRGCLLYALDSDGLLNVFSTADGRLLNQLQVYAGGSRNGNPNARLLTVSDSEQVQVMGGYLTMLTLDGFKLGGEAAACTIG